ncbi:hypothetical protein C8J46_11221 [Sphingomonas sp. PP-F2F-A104-K0414]|uniref:hypothetical protein n=1 Tax=Sphingomonas sp. PP-F2F-A104-K0414 TaxID=2135661 RepID=UPI0010452C93|nr:hypothetical protein [Sphingomonas sp. PP-F2F-A104-K0414]TCP95649.1 hypothetical protein C8J46_11221 [Sphingomonas sp. PP-F2F-A104-K0414]
MQKKIEHFTELAVIGVSSGATGAVVVAGLQGIADPGDLLGFLGAAVGAFLTIGGALWVEARKRDQQNSVRREQALGVLSGFQGDLDTIQNARTLFADAQMEGHSGNVERIFFAQQCADLGEFGEILDASGFAASLDSPRSHVAVHRLRRILKYNAADLRHAALAFDNIQYLGMLDETFDRVETICAAFRFELDFLLETMGEAPTADDTSGKRSMLMPIVSDS